MHRETLKEARNHTGNDQHVPVFERWCSSDFLVVQIEDWSDILAIMRDRDTIDSHSNTTYDTLTKKQKTTDIQISIFLYL